VAALGDTGLEPPPLTNDKTNQSRKTDGKGAAKCAARRGDSPFSAAGTIESDPDAPEIERIVAAWPRLPELIRQGNNGNNGKNVLLDTISALMGDYAGEAPPDLLTVRKHPEHPTEIADLLGKRLVIALETELDAQLRLQFIKRAKDLGFSLREIKELLCLRVDQIGRASCRERV